MLLQLPRGSYWNAGGGGVPAARTGFLAAPGTKVLLQVVEIREEVGVPDETVIPGLSDNSVKDLLRNTFCIVIPGHQERLQGGEEGERAVRATAGLSLPSRKVHPQDRARRRQAV